MLEKLLDDDNLQTIGDFFKVLADKGRLTILYSLIEGELCVSEIAARTGLSPSLVSHQLRVLRHSHLVKYERRGKQSIYKLDDEHVSMLIEVAYEHLEHRGEL
jgi:ArsR family transcriptional regulator